MDSITCGYPHYFDKTRTFFNAEYCGKNSCGRVAVCWRSVMSRHPVIWWQSKTASVLTVMLHSPFRWLKYVIWYECEFTWYSDSNKSFHCGSKCFCWALPTDWLIVWNRGTNYMSIKLKSISSKQALSLSLNLQQLIPVFLQLSLLQIFLASPQVVLCKWF